MKQLMVFLAMMAALFQTKFKAAEDDTNLTAAQNLQIDNYAPTYNEPADNRHRNGSQKGFAGLLKDMIMVMWRTFARMPEMLMAAKAPTLQVAMLQLPPRRREAGPDNC